MSGSHPTKHSRSSYSAAFFTANLFLFSFFVFFFTVESLINIQIHFEGAESCRLRQFLEEQP